MPNFGIMAGDRCFKRFKFGKSHTFITGKKAEFGLLTEILDHVHRKPLLYNYLRQISNHFVYLFVLVIRLY